MYVLMFFCRKRTAAKLLAQKWHDRPLPPIESAIFYIEQTARYSGLQMSSYARRLNGLQVAMLDVIGFLVGIFVGIVMLLRWFCGQCTKRRYKEKSC